MLAAAEIETLVRGERAAAGVVAALFSAAMEAGGRDNITIAVVDVEPA